MTARGGGDGPERQLDALLATLALTDSDNLAVMTTASEIVVLTDHTSHNLGLADTVINTANAQNVCINFFLSMSGEWSDDVYRRIADETHGTVTSTIISDNAFTNFDSSHDYLRCARSYRIPVNQGRKKRQTSSSTYSTEQQCHHFSTSLFTTAVKVTGHTSQQSVIVTKPNRERVTVPYISWVDAVFRDNPLSGEWSVCVSTGTLTITIENKDRMDNILQYLRPIESSHTFAMKYTPPPARESKYNHNLS